MAWSLARAGPGIGTLFDLYIRRHRQSMNGMAFPLFYMLFFFFFGSFCLDFAMVVFNEGDGLDKVNSL